MKLVSMQHKELRPHLLQALPHKVVAGQGPVVPVRQLRGGFTSNEEDHAHGVNLPSRGLRLCHLYGRDTGRPHIHLCSCQSDINTLEQWPDWVRNQEA